MSKSVFVAVGLALFILGSCGAGGKSSGPDSGSSSGISSSSANDRSSSSVGAPGKRAAVLDDIPEILDYGLDGEYTVKFIFGKASGVFSKLYYQGTNSAPSVHMVGLYTLRQDGLMALEYKDCLATDAVRQSLCVAAHQEPELVFLVDLANDSLYVGVSQTQLNRARTGSLVLPPLATAMRDPAQLRGAWRSVSGNDTTRWEFYPQGRYARERISGGQRLTQVGRYDIQRSQLILIQTHTAGQGEAYLAEFYTALMKEQNLELSETGATQVLILQKGDSLPSPVSEESLRGAWEGVTSSHVYALDLSAESRVSLNIYKTGNTNPAYTDTGLWFVVGNWLVLDFNDGKACSGDGSVGLNVNGQISCYSRVVDRVTVNGSSMDFSNAYFPRAWTK